MKLAMLISITIFGTLGGCFGNLFDHQSFFNLLAFGGWAILFTTIGSFFGIWVVVKFKDYF